METRGTGRATISVVIPNYNHGKYLPTALNAIFDQPRVPDEVIVVDDGSTDNSVEVLSDFAARYTRLKWVRNETNQGVVFSGNRGLDLAHCDYVYFASADDMVLPGFFEKSMAVLEEHPDAGLCCTIGEWIEESTGFRWHVGVGMANEPSRLTPEEMVRLELKNRLFIASHTVIFRRSVVHEFGKFRPELRWHCDWHMIQLAGFRYGICHVPEPLARFHIHPTSYYTSGRKKKQQHEDVIRALLKELHRPEYFKEADRIRRSGALYIFGWPMLAALLRDRDRFFLTGAFLRKNIWHITKLQGKKITPKWLADIYFRVAGYRV